MSEKTSLRLTQVTSVDQQTIYSNYLTVLSNANENVSTNITTLSTKLQTYNSELAAYSNSLTKKTYQNTSIDEEIQIQINNVEIARAELAATKEQLSKSTIIAPFSGTIGKVTAEIGESISNNQAIITLFSDSKYQVSVNIPELDVAKIKSGDKAYINLDAYSEDDQWEGILENIELVETEIDGVPVYVGEITITNPDSRIRIGMNARATIELNKLTDVIAVPSSFVKSKGSTHTVLVKTDEKSTEERQVEVGLKGSNSFIEIKSGLQIGEILVKP